MLDAQFKICPWTPHTSSTKVFRKQVSNIYKIKYLTSTTCQALLSYKRQATVSDQCPYEAVRVAMMANATKVKPD